MTLLSKTEIFNYVSNYLLFRIDANDKFKNYYQYLLHYIKKYKPSVSNTKRLTDRNIKKNIDFLGIGKKDFGECNNKKNCDLLYLLLDIMKYNIDNIMNGKYTKFKGIDKKIFFSENIYGLFVFLYDYGENKLYDFLTLNLYKYFKNITTINFSFDDDELNKLFLYVYILNYSIVNKQKISLIFDESNLIELYRIGNEFVDRYGIFKKYNINSNDKNNNNKNNAVIGSEPKDINIKYVDFNTDDNDIIHSGSNINVKYLVDTLKKNYLYEIDLKKQAINMLDLVKSMVPKTNAKQRINEAIPNNNKDFKQTYIVAMNDFYNIEDKLTYRQQIIKLISKTYDKSSIINVYMRNEEHMESENKKMMKIINRELKVDIDNNKIKYVLLKKLDNKELNKILLFVVNGKKYSNNFCYVKDCKNRAQFNNLENLANIYCNDHKTENMYDVEKIDNYYFSFLNDNFSNLLIDFYNDSFINVGADFQNLFGYENINDTLNNYVDELLEDNEFDNVNFIKNNIKFLNYNGDIVYNENTYETYTSTIQNLKKINFMLECSLPKDTKLFYDDHINNGKQISLLIFKFENVIECYSKYENNEGINKNIYNNFHVFFKNIPDKKYVHPYNTKKILNEINKINIDRMSENDVYVSVPDNFNDLTHIIDNFKHDIHKIMDDKLHIMELIKTYILMLGDIHDDVHNKIRDIYKDDNELFIFFITNYGEIIDVITSNTNNYKKMCKLFFGEQNNYNKFKIDNVNGIKKLHLFFFDKKTNQLKISFDNYYLSFEHFNDIIKKYIDQININLIINNIKENVNLLKKSLNIYVNILQEKHFLNKQFILDIIVIIQKLDNFNIDNWYNILDEIYILINNYIVNDDTFPDKSGKNVLVRFKDFYNNIYTLFANVIHNLYIDLTKYDEYDTSLYGLIKTYIINCNSLFNNEYYRFIIFKNSNFIYDKQILQNINNIKINLESTFFMNKHEFQNIKNIAYDFLKVVDVDIITLRNYIKYIDINNNIVKYNLLQIVNKILSNDDYTKISFKNINVKDKQLLYEMFHFIKIFNTIVRTYQTSLTPNFDILTNFMNKSELLKYIKVNYVISTVDNFSDPNIFDSSMYDNVLDILNKNNVITNAYIYYTDSNINNDIFTFISYIYNALKHNIVDIDDNKKNKILMNINNTYDVNLLNNDDFMKISYENNDEFLKKVNNFIKTKKNIICLILNIRKNTHIIKNDYIFNKIQNIEYDAEYNKIQYILNNFAYKLYKNSNLLLFLLSISSIHKYNDRQYVCSSHKHKKLNIIHTGQKMRKLNVSSYNIFYIADLRGKISHNKQIHNNNENKLVELYYNNMYDNLCILLFHNLFLLTIKNKVDNLPFNKETINIDNFYDGLHSSQFLFNDNQLITIYKILIQSNLENIDEMHKHNYIEQLHFILLNVDYNDKITIFPIQFFIDHEFLFNLNDVQLNIIKLYKKIHEKIYSHIIGVVKNYIRRHYRLNYMRQHYYLHIVNSNIFDVNLLIDDIAHWINSHLPITGDEVEHIIAQSNLSEEQDKVNIIEHIKLKRIEIIYKEPFLL